MLTLYDYLPSQNAWKVRQLLYHLGLPHRTEHVGIFEGEGRRESFLRISPAGTVPAIELDDGRVLAESNAILCFLADGTPYLPGDAFARRSEEHTSELQSLMRISYAVFCLKKKKKTTK